MKKLIAIGLTAAFCATVSLAQPGQRLGRECRQAVMQLCGRAGDRPEIRVCLTKEHAKLPDGCRQKLISIGRDRMGGGIEYAYGGDPKQKLDFWRAKQAKAPLLIFVHGGGWAIGDKGNDRSDKAGFYKSRGYAYASLNYRLVPNARPDDQVADIASAIGWLRKHAARLGFDRDHIILMGHSAGAHLAALVSSDPHFLANAGVPMAAIRGTILLDGAGYDLPAQMAFKGNRVSAMYDAAFGTDPAYQKAMSPINHTSAPNVANWLLLHVASRPDSATQSGDLGKALTGAGAKADVVAVPDSSHRSVNRDAGVADSFVARQIEAFLAKAN